LKKSFKTFKIDSVNNLAALHISVILFGFAGIFGRLNIAPLIIVAGRVFFASIFLGSVLLFFKKPVKIPVRKYFLISVTGALLALHWGSFFYSISISSVSVGLISFSTFPVFVVFLEPLFLKTQIKGFHFLFAGIVLGAVILIVPDYDFTNNVTKGLAWGILSGFTFGLITVLNRRYVQSINPIFIALLQDVTAFFVLLPFIISSMPHLSNNTMLLLMLLGVVFTGIAHTLYIYSLKGVSAQRASIITSLEPVYGIAAAFLILHEAPQIRVLLGGLIIISVAICISAKSEIISIHKSS